MEYLLLLLVIIGVGYFAWPGNKTVPDNGNGVTIVNDVVLSQHVRFFSNLPDIDKIRFKEEVKAFLSTVKITAVDTMVTDIDKLLVASSAVIPVFSFTGWRYHNLQEVLLYSDAINSNFETMGDERNILGMVGTGYMEGKMLLSKPALQLGFSNATDKKNTAIHEFVHLVDKADGETDGIPEILMDKQYVLPWLEMIRQETEKIGKGKSDIDPYAYSNKTEFLAVVAEYFFERPDLLKTKHPGLYNMLEIFFNGR